ncbi:MAG: HRDC domain-containing protein, partial [Firmicutes bacterium]|nr:HRDC domain-containing protein [Bacillota bacterium]
MSQIQNKVMSPEDKKRIAENRQLYERLFRVREELKIKYTASGRVPPICTDQALLDIARNKPLRAEDFALLPGVGKTFAEKYAKYFIPILMEFKSRNVQVADSNPKIKATLSKLEDRLVNINRRNKMLYMPKLHSRQTFDLYSRELITEKFMDFLMRGKPRALKVVDIKPMNDSLENLDAEQQRYVRLTNIVREINKDFRESGNYDAYIAYPFVEGKIIGEDFPVRAPLALFPVQIKVENNFVAVELDRDKDVLYNTNLILLQNKFNKVSRDVPSPVVGDINYQTFISDLVQFYKENGIEIMLNLFETEEYKKQKEELLKLEELKSKDLSFFSYEAGNFDDFLKMHRPKQEEQLENIKEDKVTIDRFTEYTASNFPKYLNGEFFIRHNAVLGQFSLHSTAMQRDFKKIMDSDSLNVLVSELLENYDEIDLYADEDAEIAQIDENIPVKESQINYINNLNASQEQVIVKIQNTDKLVIQGPPGTGKSQSITSLISDFSSKGKTILMVSQKKAALEVIHSRLGHLNKYTVFISDVKDKNSFYEQMMRLTAEASFSQTPESSTGEIADFIEKRIDRLNRISEVLFENRKEGVPMYRLYQENTANQLKCKENDNLAKFLPMAARVVSEELRGRKYTDMLTSFNLINNERILQKVKEYLDIKKTDAWVTTIRPNMSRMEQVNFSNDAAEFIKNQEEFLSKNIFARMFKSGKTKKELKEMFKKYFTERTYFKELFKNPYKLGKKKERGMLTDKEGLVGMELYNKYSFLKTELVNLTENEFTFAAAAIN